VSLPAALRLRRRRRRLSGRRLCIQYSDTASAAELGFIDLNSSQIKETARSV